MTSALERPFVTARTAAAALGVPQSVVEADVRRVYPLECLIGADVNGIVYVSAWELEGERLAAHRARLARVGDSVTVGSPGATAVEAPVTQPDRETPVA